MHEADLICLLKRPRCTGQIGRPACMPEQGLSKVDLDTFGEAAWNAASEAKPKFCFGRPSFASQAVAA